MQISLEIEDSDCEWFYNKYGPDWPHRVEQHIRNEVHARQQRSGWHYEPTFSGTTKSTRSRVRKARIRVLHGNGSRKDAPNIDRIWAAGFESPMHEISGNLPQ